MPNFARHKVSIETMAGLTDEDLRKVKSVTAKAKPSCTLLK